MSGFDSTLPAVPKPGIVRRLAALAALALALTLVFAFELDRLLSFEALR